MSGKLQVAPTLPVIFRSNSTTTHGIDLDIKQYLTSYHKFPFLLFIIQFLTIVGYSICPMKYPEHVPPSPCFQWLDPTNLTTTQFSLDIQQETGVCSPNIRGCWVPSKLNPIQLTILWACDIAMENHHLVRWFTYYWWVSVAMSGGPQVVPSLHDSSPPS